MRKVLSLKKNKAPAKAQPSITSFFSVNANSTSAQSSSEKPKSDENTDNAEINKKRKFETEEELKYASEANKKIHNLLNKGKYSNNDQIVPSIHCFPSKRVKFSEHDSNRAGLSGKSEKIKNDGIIVTNPKKTAISPGGNNLRRSPRHHKQSTSPHSDNEFKEINTKTPIRIPPKLNDKPTSARKALKFLADNSALEGKIFDGSIKCSNGNTEESVKEKSKIFNISVSPNRKLKERTLDSDDPGIKPAASETLNAESPEQLLQSYKNILKPMETCGILISGDIQKINKISPNCKAGDKENKSDYSILECKLDSSEKDDFGNMFDGDWDSHDFSELNATEELDLTSWQRCYVADLTREPKTFNITLKLKEEQSEKRSTCMLEGIWRDLELNIGDLVSIIVREVDDEGVYHINNASGFLVQQPDTLISSTTIVGSLFCKRKVVLQDRFKGIDCSNKAMTMGSFVHELLQISLKKNLCTAQQINAAGNDLLQSPNVMHMLYAADMSYDEACLEMTKFVPQIVSFIKTYVVGNRTKADLKKPKADWNGTIDSVLDIEENIWSPKIGVKGKIDVTLKVTIHDRNKGSLKKIMPLELKTGKASGSAEHRGQVILYLMMMSLNQVQGSTAMNTDLTDGLLLYLRDTMTVKEVPSGHHEKRDLLILRNQLVQYLIRKSSKESRVRNKHLISNSESDCTDYSESGKTDEMPTIKLPEPINHHSACGKCEYLTLCALHLTKDKSITLNADHPLSKLKPEALSHITDDHMSYLTYWTGLLLLEDMEKVGNPLKDIWTVDPVTREKRGKCLARLLLSRKVTDSDGKYLHTFSKPKNEQSGDLQESQFQLGEYLIVSTDHKIAVAAGCISFINRHEIRLALDRDLSTRNNIEMVYNLDGYESQNMTAFNMTNIGALMDDTPVMSRLRSIIIDKSVAKFTEHLPRHVATLGKRILAGLNVVQQRAVLKALTADSYLLIKGMPGTGKTQTVVALIEMLVALGKSVLVTSQTHSAVDNVLLRLPKDLQVMRLGSSSRVMPQLLMTTEDSLTAHCTTPQQLKEVYDSVKVIGVTCFGAGHPMLTKKVFDVCLVDESTQVLQSTVLRPLFAAHKFVLIGDPEQLPPIVRSNVARELGLSESLFARLDGLGATVDLTLQYRMNKRIMQLANAFTYEGQLVCGNDAVRDATLQLEQVQYPTTTGDWLMPCLSSTMDHSIVVVNTGNTHMLNVIMREQLASPVVKTQRDFTNVAETVLVLELLRCLCEAGTKTENIGVIAPYRDQVAFLKKSLLNCTKNNLKTLPNSKMAGVKRWSPRKRKDNPSLENKMMDCDRLTGVEVNTVDQYQGRDKDVIIYSCTRTWDSGKGEFSVKDSEILEDKRRLTVAITRAKHKLIIIGDVQTLQSYSTFRQLFNCIEDISSNVDVKKVVLEPPGDEQFNSMFLNFKSCLL